MISTPQITQSTAQQTAIIHLTIPREEIRNVMGPGLSEVRAAIAAQAIAPAGPWFTHHLKMDPDTFDFEIGVPVAAPVKPAGRVQPGQLPATTVARTVFQGDYEGLGAAWAEFDAWIAAQGHTPAGDLWERYLVDPESSPDPAAWRTELNRPLTGSAKPNPALKRLEKLVGTWELTGRTLDAHENNISGQNTFEWKNRSIRVRSARMGVPSRVVGGQLKVSRAQKMERMTQ